ILTGQKAPVDEKPTIEEQLNMIIDDTNIEEKYKESLDKQEQRHIISKSKFFKVKGNVLYRKDRREKDNWLKVVQAFEVKPILFLAHNHPIGGHMSQTAMFKKIKRYYFWPQIFEAIKEYVCIYNSCQRQGKNKLQELLYTIQVDLPFYRIGINIVGPLPIMPQNKRYIVVATDYMSKWPEARALEKDNAIEVAEFIYEEIICRHGCPQYIVSDQDTHFRNELITALLKKFQIVHKLSTLYYSQSNGLVECYNKTLCE
ncbi:8294_t:CDS:2, partial [Dentiscutata erythropus]